MVWEEADLFQGSGGDLGNQYADKRRLWDDNLMLRMATNLLSRRQRLQTAN